MLFRSGEVNAAPLVRRGVAQPDDHEGEAGRFQDTPETAGSRDEGRGWVGNQAHVGRHRQGPGRRPQVAGIEDILRHGSLAKDAILLCSFQVSNYWLLY